MKAPVNPAAALRVKLPATEGGDLEIATRGSVFSVRQEGGATPASGHGKGATFYGVRHFWTAVGEQAVEEAGLWLTQRVEEYVVLEGGGQPFQAHYEVTVPEGVDAVRDAGDYLEFLDGRDVPVLRLHHAVARDSAGLSRQGEVRLWGVAAEPMQGQGFLPRLALKGRTLRVEMTVELEGMEGPVVVDPGWSSTGSMASGRGDHTATLLPSGKVLVAGGYNNSSYFSSAEVYDAGTGTWASTGSMVSGRGDHTATLLPSGKVLVAGGYNNGTYHASAEVYDPGTGTWASTGSMASARREHTATLLPSGKVLVAGGLNSNGYHASAEVYDPGTGTWASTGSMASGREYHTATLLPSGKVLVAGGFNNGTYHASAEVYDPRTGTWASTGSMASARRDHTATLLPSGKVLVAGGFNNGTYHASAEVYDPRTGTWASTGSMASARYYHTATLLPSGKVLVAGGYIRNSLASAEVYDPGTGTWASTGSMASARYLHTATLLPSGKVLVAGGLNSNGYHASAEMYDPGTGTWASTGSMVSARGEHTATLLPSGKVLVAGGYNNVGGPLASAEVYDPGTGTWASTGPMASARREHTATLLPSGRVLVAGGFNGSYLASVEMYEDTGALDAWRPIVQALALRPGATVNVTGSGFRGVSEASSGNTQSSATNFPLLSLTAVEGGALTRMPGGNFSDTSVTTNVPAVPDGYYLLTVMTNAIPGGRMVLLDGTPPPPPVVVTPASGAVVNTSTPVISGTAEASSTVTVSLDGMAAGTAVANGSGSWSLTPSTALSQGPHSVMAQATDAAGNTSPASSSRSFTVDTVAPTAPVVVAPASGAFVNMTTPVISGTSEAGSTVTVSLDGTAAGTAVANGSGNWSLTPSTALSQGLHSVTAQATDAAGNTSPASSSCSFTVDTVAPTVPVVLTPASGAVVNTSTPVISGTAEANSTVTISLDGTVAGTAPADGSGIWNFTSSTSLTQGLHSVTARATDAAGNTSPASSSRSFTVDTVAPTKPVVLTPSSGAFVNTTTPVILGTAEANSTVTISLDGTVAGTTVANGSGSWSLTPSTALSQGPHSVTAQATDAAGNTGPVSSSRSFTVDTVAPTAPVVLTPASGAMVNISTPVISGTAEGGSTVTISLDGTVAGTVVANASGSWSFTPSTALAEGPRSVTARASDAAGNTGPSSSPRSFTVDTVAPPVPEVLTPVSGAVVNTSRPVTSGTAGAGNTVTISFDGAVAGTAVANASGDWSFTPSTALAEGPHSVTAQASDAAGNTGPTSSPHSFTVDTVAPPAPVVLMPASGAVVSTSTPVISGTAEAGSTVTISFEGTVAGTAVANASGSWSFTPSTALAQGPHSVTAQASDVAGNTSPASSPGTFAVDTVAPATPVVTSPAAGAVVDTKNPTVTGTAEVGTTVTVILDGVEVGTEAVSDTGTWNFTPAEALPLGSHTLAARGMDASGNQGPASVSTSFTIATRGHYGGCASAPTSPVGWVAVALGVGWLRRRERRQRVQLLRTPGRRALALLCLVCLISGAAFGGAPTPPADPKSPSAVEKDSVEPDQESSALSLMAGLRSEAELLKRGITPSLTAELSGGSNARLPDVRLGAALTALFLPMGVRAEGRLYPYDLGPPGKWRVRPYLALGATYFLTSGGVGGRGSLGAALQFRQFQLFADVAYERFFTSSDTYYYEPNAVLVSLGVGWSPFSGR